MQRPTDSTTHVPSLSRFQRRQQRIAIWSTMTDLRQLGLHETKSDTANIAAEKGSLMTRYIPEETLAATVILRVKHKFRQRLVEWAGAFEIGLLGLILMHSGSTFGNSTNWLLMESIATEETWSYTLFWVGTIRLAGLWINGAMEAVTPWIRTAGAFSGLFVFGSILSSMIYAWIWLGVPPSTGLAPYGVGFVMEIASIILAVADARIYRNGSRERRRNQPSP